jgi:hypothetical protein
MKIVLTVWAESYKNGQGINIGFMESLQECFEKLLQHISREVQQIYLEIIMYFATFAV